MSSFDTFSSIAPLITLIKQNAPFKVFLPEVDKVRVLEQTAALPIIELIRDKTIDILGRLVLTKLILCKLEAAAIPTLLDHLADKDFEVRGVCLQVLGGFKDRRAVEPAINLLKDPNDWVRLHAADTLGRLKDERAIEPLLSVLNDQESIQISHVTDALVNIGGPTFDAVTEIAKDRSQNKKRRGFAISAIGKFHNPDSLAILSSFLNDINEEYEVRFEASFWLGRLNNPAAIKDLITALEDPQNEIRANAARALGELGNKHAVEPLLQLVKFSNEGRLRSIAALSLGSIGDEHIIAELTQVMLTDTGEYSPGMTVSRSARHAIDRIRAKEKDRHLGKIGNHFTSSDE